MQGRKPIGDGPVRSITISLDPKRYNILEGLAKIQHRWNMSAAMRHIIDDWAVAHENCERRTLSDEREA